MANILITGASSGIGEALAYFYAKNSENVLFLCARNPVRLYDVAERCKRLGANVFEEVVDVADKNAVKKWIEKSHKKAELNLVIANAGVATDDDECVDAIYNTFNINIFGVLNTVLPTVEIFKQEFYKDKQIVIVSSIAGYYPLAQCPAYSASKNCVKSLGLAFRERYKSLGIKFNVVCPGFVRSRITDKNTCPMPFFMEAEKSAKIIAKGLSKNIGLITFPLPLRFLVWFMGALPYCVSSFFMGLLPRKN